ncbi:MAG: NAD(P)-dependent oxidoreductase, partial [Lachnospiraceae bacterium]|nr:NAD(P)-dependent oxidoreductase [Lachnospiraceae bacterium]
VSCGYDVSGIARPNSKNIDNIKDIKDKIKLYYFDLSKDDVDTMDFDIDKKEDVIMIHMAWDSSSTLGRNDESLQKNNYDTSIKIYELSKRYNTKKFIFTSSQAEDNDTPYGRYKKMFYDKCKLNDNFIHLRIFSIYGENDYHHTLIKYLVSCVKEKKDAAVGKCEHIWNYLYIDDFVRMLRCFIDNDVDTSLSYDIASDDNRLLKDYISYFTDRYGLNIIYGGRSGEDEKFSIPDITNTKKVLGTSFKFTKFMQKYNI